ncbi:hypothetical protein JNE33_06300 [Streptococcus suis]|uniref:hypothetical protein n=1 Tax=Streptococcus suis TaxID=1307 RepID=UPI00192DFE8B|nr:hypothetical protein [Streptococcus suis]MBL6440119.1 hypothetical protein [Streptococcus suis]
MKIDTIQRKKGPETVWFRGLSVMTSSQFFSKRKTRKPPAMLVADKAFSFHFFFML